MLEIPPMWYASEYLKDEKNSHKEEGKDRVKTLGGE